MSRSRRGVIVSDQGIGVFVVGSVLWATDVITLEK
jgi:hypothetical protein